MISFQNVSKKNIINNSALGKENLLLKDSRWFGLLQQLTYWKFIKPLSDKYTFLFLLNAIGLQCIMPIYFTREYLGNLFNKLTV